MNLRSLLTRKRYKEITLDDKRIITQHKSDILEALYSAKERLENFNIYYPPRYWNWNSPRGLCALIFSLDIDQFIHLTITRIILPDNVPVNLHTVFTDSMFYFPPITSLSKATSPEVLDRIKLLDKIIKKLESNYYEI